MVVRSVAQQLSNGFRTHMGTLPRLGTRRGWSASSATSAPLECGQLVACWDESSRPRSEIANARPTWGSRCERARTLPERGAQQRFERELGRVRERGIDRGGRDGGFEPEADERVLHLRDERGAAEVV